MKLIEAIKEKLKYPDEAPSSQELKQPSWESQPFGSISIPQALSEPPKTLGRVLTAQVRRPVTTIPSNNALLMCARENATSPFPPKRESHWSFFFYPQIGRPNSREVTEQAHKEMREIIARARTIEASPNLAAIYAPGKNFQEGWARHLFNNVGFVDILPNISQQGLVELIRGTAEGKVGLVAFSSQTPSLTAIVSLTTRDVKRLRTALFPILKDNRKPEVVVAYPRTTGGTVTIHPIALSAHPGEGAINKLLTEREILPRAKVLDSYTYTSQISTRQERLAVSLENSDGRWTEMQLRDTILEGATEIQRKASLVFPTASYDAVTGEYHLVNRSCFDKITSGFPFTTLDEEAEEIIHWRNWYTHVITDAAIALAEEATLAKAPLKSDKDLLTTFKGTIMQLTPEAIIQQAMLQVRREDPENVSALIAMLKLLTLPTMVLTDNPNFTLKSIEAWNQREELLAIQRRSGKPGQGESPDRFIFNLGED